jgi:DNA polymerase-1
MRAAINAPIQGGAADITKMAMINIQKELQKRKMETKMLIQVHDELVFEVPETEIDQAKELIKTQMENVVKLTVPLEVDIGIGKNWKEAH